jgi:retron-type reverse transcriptase
MYEKIISLDNLYKASHNALKGKKSTPSAAKFWLHEDEEVHRMHEELGNHAYRWGGYSTFKLRENGVERRISVAPFRDRVLHHAIMQIIYPEFEKRFIYDSYANRKGKGTLKALKRARYYANKYKYVMQLDIQKFFPSIEHDILVRMLEKRIKCTQTMELVRALIDNSNRQDDAFFYFREDTLFTPYESKKGIPLGNLTSQFFGNLYLDGFDHFVKETLRIKGYIRYVDDSLYFSNDKRELEEAVAQIEAFLEAIRLRIHPLKKKLLQTSKGFVFLGHKVFDTHFRLTSKSIRRGRKKCKKLVYSYRYEKQNIEEVKNRLFGILGFFSMGNNYTMTEELLAQTVLVKNRL